jgi:hypothetical protein
MNDNKKERVSLGIAVPVTNKAKPSAYDLKGSITVDGKNYRFGAYMSEAKGNGKMPAGQKYYYFHRVELIENEIPLTSAGNTDFDPAELEA